MANKLKVLILSSLFIAALCVYTGGAVDMDDIVHISAEKEKKMGMSLSAQVEKKFESVEDVQVQERFQNIGKRIADVCERKEFVYHFKVLRAKEGEAIEQYYNAFTLPGGYVYMFEPLLNVLEADDRIAAVTAHEIGHTTARHVVKRLQSSLGTNILMLLALATAQDGRTVAEANEAITHLMLSYSREDEFEADRLSVRYLKEAGFDPDGVVGSLLVLKKLRKKGREFPYSPYRSHPYLSERIAAARSEIKGYTDFESYINLPDEKESPH